MLLSAPSSLADIHHGSVELTLENRDGRTCLARSRTRPPLQVQRALYPDPALPHLALVMLSNPTGGIFQGDHHRIAVTVGPGAAAHVTGQGATRIHAMPYDSARQDVDLAVAGGGFLEYLPDPLIPYRDSDFEQRITLSVAPGGSLVYWEIIAPGRVAMGESFRYRRLASRLTVADDCGRPACYEAFSLDPSRGLTLARGAFPDSGKVDSGCTLGFMLVVSQNPEMDVLLPELQGLLPTFPGIAAGATRLPNRAGVGVRALGADVSAIREGLTQCWATARQRLLGSPVPFLRKY